jgi:hypothetical protein
MRLVIVRNLKANCKKIQSGSFARATPMWVDMHAVTFDLVYGYDELEVRRFSPFFHPGHFGGEIPAPLPI